MRTVTGMPEGTGKTRVHPLTPSSQTESEVAMRRLATAIAQVNDAVCCAVDAGLTVELIRSRRHHDGNGNWGDQMSVRRGVRLPRR